MKLTEAKTMIQTRKAEVRARLKQLRVDMADDTQVDPDELAQIMQDAGIDFEQLEGQVAQLKSRRAMVAEIERGNADIARSAEINHEIQAAEEAFAAVQQEHNRDVAKLRSEQSGLTESYQLISIEQNLRKGATDPDLRAAKEEVNSQSGELGRQQKGLEYQQKNHSVESRRLKSEIERQRSQGYTPKPHLAVEAESQEDKANEIGKEIRQLQEERIELDARMNELMLQELVPNAF